MAVSHTTGLHMSLIARSKEADDTCPVRDLLQIFVCAKCVATITATSMQWNAMNSAKVMCAHPLPAVHRRCTDNSEKRFRGRPRRQQACDMRYMKKQNLGSGLASGMFAHYSRGVGNIPDSHLGRSWRSQYSSCDRMRVRPIKDSDRDRRRDDAKPKSGLFGIGLGFPHPAQPFNFTTTTRRRRPEPRFPSRHARGNLDARLSLSSLRRLSHPDPPPVGRPTAPPSAVSRTPSFAA